MTLDPVHSGIADPFTVAKSVLTPEMASRIHSLFVTAILDQWSCRDLANSVEAEIETLLAAEGRKAGGR